MRSIAFHRSETTGRFSIRIRKALRADRFGLELRVLPYGGGI